MTNLEAIEIDETAFLAVQKRAKADGSSFIYACIGDTYFPNFEFMTLKEVTRMIGWWDKQDGGDHWDGIWAAVKMVSE
jgi:hypothetical protein